MSHRRDRRQFLGLAIKTAGGVVVFGSLAEFLAACAGGSSTVSTTPRRGGTVTFATEAEINSFDPRQGAWDSSGLQYARTVFDPLFSQAADGSIKPYLAESIDHNADYTEWTIKLRPNIKFHDGSPLDANTVKINLDGVRASPLTGPGLFNLASITAVDTLTVLVKTKNPWVPFPIYLTGQDGTMAGLKQLADTSGKAQPIGTGPFMFKEWVPGDHFTAVRNPNYWQKDLPYLDSITYKPIVDPQSRANSLKAGNIDIMHSSDNQNVADLMNNSSFSQINDINNLIGEPDLWMVMLNTAVPPMDDLRVRQALAYAVDRKKVIDTIFNGLTKPADGPFPPGHPYYVQVDYPSYDLAKAKSLVDSYTKDKGPISFKYGTVNAPKYLQTNQLIQSMWKAAGINTEIVQFEQSPYILNAILGNYQAIAWRQFGTPDPDGNYVWWSSATASPPGHQALNFARNKDQKIDIALETGRRLPDPATRAAAYQTIQKQFAADMPYVFITKAIWIVASKKAIKGWDTPLLPDGSKARQMCTGDALRLCSSEIPNIARITACMVRNKANVSQGCRAVMDEEAAAASKPRVAATPVEQPAATKTKPVQAPRVEQKPTTATAVERSAATRAMAQSW